VKKLPIANCRLPIFVSPNRSAFTQTSSKSAIGNRQLVMRFCLGLFMAVFVCVSAVNAQDPEPLPTERPSPTPLTAPPPIKIISKEERAQINQAGDSKDRIRTTMELAALRIGRAEQLAKDGRYDDALTEVGSYEALIQDTLDFLKAMKRDSNKTRDLCKRVDIALRAHGPRLTTMRRETPLEFAVWIKKVEEFARAARTEVLNTFYGHTVVREPEKTDKRQAKPAQSPTPSPKSNQP
jgi:hypothetical protein